MEKSILSPEIDADEPLIEFSSFHRSFIGLRVCIPCHDINTVPVETQRLMYNNTVYMVVVLISNTSIRAL
jgi:hypothetical protein